MRALVTGAAGFVGSYVVRELLRDGCEVVALVRPGSAAERLADVRDQLTVWHADLAHVRGGLRRHRPDVCFHLAWYAEPGKYLDSPINTDCLNQSLALTKALASAGCQHLIAAGTCAEYAESESPLREDSPLTPATRYAEAKRQFGEHGRELAASLGMRFSWARLFYLYGPTEDGRRLVPALTRALRNGEVFPAGDGKPVRDYLHVADVASGLVTMMREQTDGVFNVCSGEPISVRGLMEAVARQVGGTGTIRFGARPPRGWEPPFIVGDNTALRSLGWRPRFGLADLDPE